MAEYKSITRVDIEPHGGIAGDMFAAALFSAFPQLYEKFLHDLDCLNIPDLSVFLEDRQAHSLHAKYFCVQQGNIGKPPRTLKAVKEYLQGKSLAPDVIQHAIGIFSLLAEAEAAVHGKTINTVHFHEVSDWDSMVDIIAAAGIIARLDCHHWRIGSLPLGRGTVNTAHGDIPVPAPATVALLRGFAWHDDGIAGERVTPTGAAIVTYLKAVPDTSAVSSAELVSTGSGCGTRELPGRANVLRVIAFTETKENCGFLSDEVVRLAFEIDDMTAEEIAWATDKLRAGDGVLDLSCLVMQAKKGRTSTGVRLLVSPLYADAVMQQCFAVTSTLGVRYEVLKRKVLRRTEQRSQDTEEKARDGAVGVKLVGRAKNSITAKVESDDLSVADTLDQRRKIAYQHQQAVLQRARDKA